MNDMADQAGKVLDTFPKECCGLLRWMITNGGELSSSGCKGLLDVMEIELEQLMLRLLPLAKLYGIVPISNFPVGFVAKGITNVNENDYTLYLGANLEFPGQALNQSVHAEQAVVMNAWQKGVKQVQWIAVSASPCGHCRQFLKELEKSDSIMIITSANNNQSYELRTLPELLPDGFGPHDLNRETGMMAEIGQRQTLTLKLTNDDPLVKKALYAASQSYVPYTGNLAGCAIQDSEGEVYIGRCAENAAFNPSVSPLQAAICIMNMDKIGKNPVIQRVILVEKKTKSSQYHTTRQLLKSCVPHVNLEYFEIE